MKSKLYTEENTEFNIPAKFQDIEIIGAEDNLLFIRVLGEEEDYYVQDLSKDNYCLFVDNRELLNAPLNVIDTIINKALRSEYHAPIDPRKASQEVQAYLQTNKDKLMTTYPTLWLWTILFLNN